MSGPSVIIIIGGGNNANRVEEGDSSGDAGQTVIKIKIESEGSVSDILREAADVIDGNA